MAKSKKQKRSSAGKNIAVFFIVFVILEALLILGIRYVFKTEDSVPKLGGYSFYVMDSANMEKDIPRDALVIAENGTPSTDKRGYAVVAKNVGNEGTTVAWLYDIGSKGDTVDGVVYTVYQESAPDKMYDLESKDIIGVTASYYMTAGKIISFVRTPFGMVICLAAPIVLLIFLELIVSIASRSKYDEYEDEDEDLEEQVRRRRAEKENVTLDDFLYGGQDDDVYTSDKPAESYEEEFEDKYASLLDNKEKTPEIDFSEPAPAAEQVVRQAPPQRPQPEPAPEPQPEFVPEPEPVQEAPAEPADQNVDPSYYERASKMIDDAVQQKMNTQDFEAVKSEAVQPAAAPAPAPAAEPAQAPAERPQRPPQQRRRRPEGQRPAGHRPRPDGSRPAQRRRPANRRPRPIPPHQDANATLEQLMKLMEAEQQKLKDQSGDNQ